MSEKSQTTLPGWRGTANKRRTRGLIGNELLQIFEIYDDTEVAVHLVNILRSKGKIISYKEDGVTPVYRDPYYMKDAETLKEIEVYRAELDSKIADPEDKD
jgi:hypothetical protein